MEMIEGIKFWLSRDLYNLIVLFAALLAVGLILCILWVVETVRDKRKKRRKADGSKDVL